MASRFTSFRSPRLGDCPSKQPPRWVPGPHGFTLVEVLIAALILSAALSVAALGFRVALQGFEQANEALRLAEAATAIRGHITVATDQGETQGRGTWNGMDYQWARSVVAAKVPAQSRTMSEDPFLGQLDQRNRDGQEDQPAYEIVLERIRLDITLQDPGAQSERTQSWTFEQLRSRRADAS